MENILLLYQFDDCNDTCCTSLQVDIFKEVLLIDIYKALHKLNIDYSYNVLAATTLSGSTWVALFSPYSVVPVLENSRVLIRLYASGSPHIVPTEQSELFNTMSRRYIYSDKACAAIDKHINPAVYPHGKLLRSSKPHTLANETNQTTLQQIVNDETVIAIANTAKEAAGTAARSLLNFAAISIKNVSEAAAALSQSNCVTLGNSKVTIVRELAEGGKYFRSFL